MRDEVSRDGKISGKLDKAAKWFDIIWLPNPMYSILFLIPEKVKFTNNKTIHDVE